MERGQLPLALSLDTQATFDNYYVAAGQQLAVSQLRAMADGSGESLVYLAGRTGRRHLLQACCHRAESRGRYVRYIPLAELCEYSPELVLDGVEQQDLVCLDNIEMLAGRRDWERAVFNLYNRCLGSRCQLLFAAREVPSALNIELPDLASRLQSFSVYRLSELSEADRIAALQQRAEVLGMELSDSLAEYIYRRCQRDLGSLFAVLEELDRHSLARQRRLTMPFVKEIMAW